MSRSPSAKQAGNKHSGPGRQGGRPSTPAAQFTPQATEVRALLRRVPDGLKAALNHLAAKPAEERERVLTELARGLGKEFLPVVRSAALHGNEGLALSALRVLPVFGTRAAGEVLVEAFEAHPEGDRAHWARVGVQAIQARGVNVSVPGDTPAESGPRLTLRDTCVSAPDGAGSRSVAARFQDNYGVWHAIFVLWNDQAGVKDGFKRPVSRQEWMERLQKEDERAPLWVSCPPDFARWLVQHAREINGRTGFPLDNHLTAWDELMGAPPEGYQPPDPREAVAELTEEEREAALTGSQDLVKTPDAERWFFEIADVVPFVREWIDLQNRFRLRKEGDADGARQELEALIRRAIQEHVQGEVLRLYRERLLDLARVCEWRQQPQNVRKAAAVVTALDGGTEPADLSFFVALMQRTLLAGDVVLRRGEDPEKLRYKPLKRY